MPSRTRTDSTPDPAGTRTDLSTGTVFTRTSPDMEDWVCKDVIGNFGGENPFDNLTRTRAGSKVNGINGNFYFQDFPTGTRSFASVPAISNSSLNSYRAAALAQTGLAKPSVNVPLFVGELKDVPRMLKHAGDILHKVRIKPTDLLNDQEAAAATLAYQFGWRPLVSDLRKLLDFQDHVDKRARQLYRMYADDVGMSRRATLEDSTSVDTRNRTVGESLAGGTRVLLETETLRKEVWATVRWVPKVTTIGSPSVDDLNARAFRDALGLSAKNIPLTAWKLLPWSWLTDWFAGMSDFLIAHQNLVDYSPRSMCIMCRMTGTLHRPRYVFPLTNVEYSEYNAVSTRQFRYAGVPYSGFLPQLRLPFLDNFKLSVLGSLAILRLRRF